MIKNSTIKIFVALLIFVTFFLILKELKFIILPFLLSLILYFLFEPLYNILEKKKIPRSVSIIIILFIIFFFLNVAGAFVVTSVSNFTDNFPRYEYKLQELANSILTYLNYPAEQINKMRELTNLKNLLQHKSFTGYLSELFMGIAGIIGNSLIIIFLIIFLFLEMSGLKKRLKYAFKDRSDIINDTYDSITKEVKSYLINKTWIALLQGILFGLILWAFGVEFALLWGVFCFFADFIPNIGSIIATILPFLTALVQFNNITIPLIVLGLLVLVQNIVSNIVEPKFMGNKLNLSPLAILLSLVFWGYIWGITGMILSIPILSIIKIILLKFDQTKSLALVISERDKKFRQADLFDKIKKIL